MKIYRIPVAITVVIALLAPQFRCRVIEGLDDDVAERQPELNQEAFDGPLNDEFQRDALSEETQDRLAEEGTGREGRSFLPGAFTKVLGAGGVGYGGFGGFGQSSGFGYNNKFAVGSVGGKGFGNKILAKGVHGLGVPVGLGVGGVGLGVGGVGLGVGGVGLGGVGLGVGGLGVGRLGLAHRGLGVGRVGLGHGAGLGGYANPIHARSLFNKMLANQQSGNILNQRNTQAAAARTAATATASA